MLHSRLIEQMKTSVPECMGIFEISSSKRASRFYAEKENERWKNAIHVSRKCKQLKVDDG